MVGATRGTPDGFGQPSGSGSQQPSPPPLDLAEFLATQNELLHQIVQGQQLQQQQRDGHNVHQPQAESYLDFLRTAPSIQCDGGALGCGRLDSHNRVQVFSIRGAMFRG